MQTNVVAQCAGFGIGRAFIFETWVVELEEVLVVLGSFAVMGMRIGPNKCNHPKKGDWPDSMERTADAATSPLILRPVKPARKHESSN